MNRIFISAFLFFLTFQINSSAQSPERTVAETATSSASVTSRFLGTVEMGYLYGKVENPFNAPPSYLASPSISTFSGYQAHRLFAIGAVLGFDFYENILITPLGLGIRGSILKTRISPYYSFDIGYGLSTFSGKGEGEKPKGGWFINPMLGLRVKINNNSGFLFGLGYKEQPVETEQFNGWSTINQKITYKRFALRAGFTF